MNNFSKQFLVSEQDIRLLEEKIKSHKFNLQQLAGQYRELDKRKEFIVMAWIKDQDEYNTKKGLPLDTIASEVLGYLNDIGIIHDYGGKLYNKIDIKYKNENALTFIKRLASGNPESENINISQQDRLALALETVKDVIDPLPESEKAKALQQVGSFVKLTQPKKEDKPPIEDFGVHQNEPPKEMQGVSEFSKAIGITAKWFEDVAARYRKIESEVKIYMPSDDLQKAKDWNETINLAIIGSVLDPIFMTETKAEADRKYSTSVFHWVKIIKERIRQSKHGAGKKAEGNITDAFGHVMYTKKGHAVKRPITRERVGDAERQVVNMAIKIMEANMGMVALHNWLEDDQGPHRRMRKEFLAEYFADASMGSIKSGDPENYEHYMKDYKRKQSEKYETKL